ncbi:MAG TPA: histidine kinase [Blastocatellia bacterium]|nr:histidine kinase [Blastocatellia bacterium]
MGTSDTATLVNVVGFVTGAALYATLMAMVWPGYRSLPAVKPDLNPKSREADWLLIATALLGLAWNIGALMAIVIRGLKLGEPGLLTALNPASLGFLPAVVVHSVLRSKGPLKTRDTVLATVAGSYTVSIVSGALNLWSALFTGVAPSRAALLLLTFGFILLVVPLALLTRRQSRGPRALWMVALAIFAVSALHLSHPEGNHYSWLVELAGHHASLPLALAILYQDYRFALADIFLKRAVTLVMLVALASGLFVGIASPLLNSSSNNGDKDPRGVIVLLILWIATALVYPSLRRLVAAFVDRVILKRGNYATLRAEILETAESCETIEAMLDAACRRLKFALTSLDVNWQSSTDSPDINSEETAAPASRLWVCLPIATAEEPRYEVRIGELSAGRRLLSDDLVFLEALMDALGRQIDARRIIDERYQRDLRQQQISKLVAEAELRALRAQLNPHFLFNALTTVGYLIQTAPTRALGVLMQLTGLLRGVLKPAGEFVSLGEEIELIRSYLEIESSRFEDKLRTEIDVPANLRLIRIPSLLIQPLVENAVKHGIGGSKSGGDVKVSARFETIFTEGSNPMNLLCIRVQDTGIGLTTTQTTKQPGEGLGLKSVEQRLKSYYGAAASFVIRSEPGRGTTAEVWMPAVATADAVSQRRLA